MPLCTLHVLSLKSHTPLSTFLTTLKTSTQSNPLLLISRIIRWIILPKQLSTSALLAQNVSWDLVVILPGTDALPDAVQEKICAKWSVVVGVPTKLVNGFRERNPGLLKPDPASIPQLDDVVGSQMRGEQGSAQSLELDTELDAWISSLYGHSKSGGVAEVGKHPITMLNLLSFLPRKKESYLQYGAAFGSKVGKKFGGSAKIVGTVVEVEGKKSEKEDEDEAGWNEVAFAQYPSLQHFRAMLRDSEYQAANKKFRLPALKDTFILCTSEVVFDEETGRARL